MSDTHNQVRNMIKSFYPYAKKRYGFDRAAKIVLNADAQNSSKPLGKTAYYDPQSYSVTVYTHNRHPKDIMRSVAHELVHHTQNCAGHLTNVAGEQGQGYAQENEHLREMERQAYEQGNLCFRDWEDGIKSNVEPGTIYEKRDTNMGTVRDHFEPRKAALLERVMDKFGYKTPVREEEGASAEEFAAKNDLQVETDNDGQKIIYVDANQGFSLSMREAGQEIRAAGWDVQSNADESGFVIYTGEYEGGQPPMQEAEGGDQNTEIIGSLIQQNGFMNARESLEQMGFKVDFVTSPLPMYMLEKDGVKYAALNKKYAEDPELVVGEIAIGKMDESLNEEDDEGLSDKQKELDLDDDGNIEPEDLKGLRAGKEDEDVGKEKEEEEEKKKDEGKKYKRDDDKKKQEHPPWGKVEGKPEFDPKEKEDEDKEKSKTEGKLPDALQAAIDKKKGGDKEGDEGEEEEEKEEANEAKKTAIDPDHDKEETEEETVTLTHKTSGKEIVVTKDSAEEKKKSGEWNEAQLKEALRRVFKKNPQFIKVLKESGMSNKDFVKMVQQKQSPTMPTVDKERYTDLSAQGLEGPFQFRNGRILYYDTKEGKYYDRDQDMFLDDEEASQVTMNENITEGDFIGHHAEIDGKMYVDSNFLNAVKKIRDTFPSEMKHMGFGEFYLETPKGRIDFDRSRGQDFPGVVGRSHQLGSNPPELADELIDAMEQAGASETPQPSEAPPEAPVAEGEGDQFEAGDKVQDDRSGDTGVVVEPMVGGAIVKLDSGDVVKVRDKFLSKMEPTVMKHEEVGPLTPAQIDEIARTVAKKLIEGAKYKRKALTEGFGDYSAMVEGHSDDDIEALEKGDPKKKKADEEEEEEKEQVDESGASCGGGIAVTLKIDGDEDGDEPGDYPGDGLEPMDVEPVEEDYGDDPYEQEDELAQYYDEFPELRQKPDRGRDSAGGGEEEMPADVAAQIQAEFGEEEPEEEEEERYEESQWNDPLQEWWDIRNNQRTERFMAWAIPKKK